jgi:L-lactate dehydrogenase complex protein LldG
MNEREKILGRIREALTVEAPVPGAHGHDQPHPVSEAEAIRRAGDWLPAVGESLEARLALFRTHSADLKSDFRLCPCLSEADSTLAEIAAAEGWKKIAVHNDPLVLELAGKLNLPMLRTDGGYDPCEMETCDVGFTACDALVAQTGSVLVTSRSAGGRALSVLPPHHVVIARRDQLVADLPAAFALLKAKYGTNYPSMISFITGPSRTGDIERILVLGAHGPKKLTILCV